jgi:hypothetical protein
MLAVLNKLWVEFRYSQEMQYSSLYHFWLSLRQWWSYRPRIIHCAFCDRPMWGNSGEGPTYCSPECAHYDGVPQETEELPF